jgi:DNA replicative helicase MCM subunit Mcm2 (Cdc46/Mcm family)
LQDRLRVILNALVEMEKQTGIVKRTDLVDRLASEYDIPPGEAERLLIQLTREGTIYEPRNGYLKKT